MPRQSVRAHLRLAARNAGEKVYTSGYPCKKGHLSPRYVSSDACLACTGRFGAMLAGVSSPYMAVLKAPPLPPECYPTLNAELQRTMDAFVLAMEGGDDPGHDGSPETPPGEVPPFI